MRFTEELAQRPKKHFFPIKSVVLTADVFQFFIKLHFYEMELQKKKAGAFGGV